MYHSWPQAKEEAEEGAGEDDIVAAELSPDDLTAAFKAAAESEKEEAPAKDELR